MTRHLSQELKNLKLLVKQLVKAVQKIYTLSIEAIETGSEEIAIKAIKSDKKIDQLEIKIEEECLKILALYQPVAIDLRYIVSILKMNNDLERIADFAVNIAERVPTLTKHNKKGLVFNLPIMFNTSQEMLSLVNESFLNMDINMAYQVIKNDSIVNKNHVIMYALLKEVYEEKNYREHFEVITSYTSISRFIERVADHCTNIAEDIIYMMEGNIVRHTGIDLSTKNSKKNKKNISNQENKISKK